ncbi:MAG: serine/threonine protein kinase, partial [Phycisphaerales bacterium]|nr:serine/threonine protein kinase [Phycisphaerales bacterium]
MTPADYQRVADAFESARKLPAAEREDFVRQRFPAEEAMAQTVLRLLRHHELPQIELTIPMIVAEVNRQSADSALAAAPQRIRDFEIREVIGAGGMGVVYRATQDNPRRDVALKVVRQAWLTPKSRQRFEVESHVLGLLRHPGAAQIYEAGIWESDRDGDTPYFAMELVNGVSLTTYATNHTLDIPSRLRLLISVCETVQHAHQKGVIHRDLKPENILVTEVDGAALPKVLDFGVARLADPEQAPQDITIDGQLVGTLPYMSPEQLEGVAATIDTRSDVYSLGVILYELLT